jgi:hypothetical protein
MAEYAKRDKQIEELECELEHRKALLADVVEDYKHYHSAIVEEKNRQREAMSNILEHLNKIVEEENLTDESLEHAKTQQHDILEELEQVKLSLSEILKSNHNINNEQSK